MKDQQFHRTGAEDAEESNASRDVGVDVAAEEAGETHFDSAAFIRQGEWDKPFERSQCKPALPKPLPAARERRRLDSTVARKKIAGWKPALHLEVRPESMAN